MVILNKEMNYLVKKSGSFLLIDSNSPRRSKNMDFINIPVYTDNILSNKSNQLLEKRTANNVSLNKKIS